MKKLGEKISSFYKDSFVNKTIIFVLLTWIILAIIFGIYDLEISKQFVNKDYFLSKIVASFGEFPALFLILICSWIMASQIKFKNKLIDFGFFSISFGIGAAIILYLTAIIIYATNLSVETFNKYTTIYWILISISNLLMMYLFRTKLKDFSKRNYKIARLTTILSIVSFFIVQLLKEIWGRVRFNDLMQNFSDFTVWYLPQGITGGHSFPSGHAMFGWLFLPAILFFINKKEIQKYIIISFAIILGILVAVGRFIGGYHYASDVLFSSGIVLTLFLIFYKKYFMGKK